RRPSFYQGSSDTMDKIPPSGGEAKKIIFRASALLLLVMTVFLFAHFRSERAATNVEESIMKVERKDFAQSLRLNGTTQASRSFVVLAPRLEGAQVGSMVITKLIPAGTHVKKSDVLVEFDPQAQTKDYLDKKSTYENLVGQVAQKQAEQDIALEAMRYAQGNAARMVVHSPMEGVVVHNTIWLGGRMGTVQQGDQVRPGVPFLQVVDPSQMEVRVELNQVDLLKVHPGQRAEMHLDAYPGMTLPAVLEELSPLGHPGQFAEAVRSFAARFSFQATDPSLFPALSAALDVDLGSQKSVLVIPWQSIGSEADHAFVW